jgi:RHS repeat-associated protein
VISSWQEHGGRRWQWTTEADELGRPGSEIRETPTGAHCFVFRYDAANRLVSVNDETGRERQAWVWDAQGNLIETRRDDVIIGRWTADQADRILDWRDVQGRSIPVEYDHAGHLVRAGKDEFEYDAGGRPRRINDLLDIRCTADGSLTAWTQNGRRNRVGWCLARPIDLPGDIKVWWFDNMVLACRVDGHTRAVWTDPRGSIVGVAGSPSIADYDPWGVSSGEPPLPLGFEGRLRIGDLYDNRARLYLPQLSRFAQTDPDGVADDPNTYLYGHGNPLVWSDPTGHSAKRRGIGCLAHMPTIGLLPMISIDAYRAVGIDVASTYIKDPPFLDFGRARYSHRNKEGKEVGRTYVVGPGILETRPHLVHYDNAGEVLGKSWFVEFVHSNTLESFMNYFLNEKDPPPHLVTYNAQNERLGSTWMKRPKVTMFTDERRPYPHVEPHLNSYDRSGDETGRTYLVRRGSGESRAHLVHYD